MQNIRERGRRLGGGAVMVPVSGCWVEPVLLQQPVAVPADQIHRLNDVVHNGLGHGVVERDSGPAGFAALVAVADLVLDGRGAVGVDAQ